MAKRKRPRRHSVPGMVKFEEPDSAAWVGNKDGPLLRLAARLSVAEQALDAAMDELERAEQRLSAARANRPAKPSWFVAAAQKEEAAGEAVEQLYREIGRVRAHTKAGLAIKLRLAAQLYGDMVDEAGDESDAVFVLLHSLLADVDEG